MKASATGEFKYDWRWAVPIKRSGSAIGECFFFSLLAFTFWLRLFFWLLASGFWLALALHLEKPADLD
jgi:hypothetical protein